MLYFHSCVYFLSDTNRHLEKWDFYPLINRWKYNRNIHDCQTNAKQSPVMSIYYKLAVPARRCPGKKIRRFFFFYCTDINVISLERALKKKHFFCLRLFPNFIHSWDIPEISLCSYNISKQKSEKEGVAKFKKQSKKCETREEYDSLAAFYVTSYIPWRNSSDVIHSM